MQELLNEALRLWLFSPVITGLLIPLLGPCLPYTKEDHA